MFFKRRLLRQNKFNLPSLNITIPLYPIFLFSVILIDKLCFFISKVAFLKENGFPPYLIINTVIIEDLGILSIIIAAVILSRQLNKGLFLLPLVFGLLIFYFADSQLFQSLFERLTFTKIYEYAGEMSAIKTFFPARKLIIFAGILLFVMIFRNISLRLNNKGSFILISGVLIGIILPYINFNGRPFDLNFDGFTANVLRINQRLVLDQGVTTEALLKAGQAFPDLTAKFKEYYSGGLNSDCNENKVNKPGSGYNAKPDIIIIISESLSQVDSLRSGGVFNRLARIDNEILPEGLTLTNVVSNGSGTADAMAALFLGIEPLPTSLVGNDLLERFPPACKNKTEMKSISDQKNSCERNLICRAKNNGYKTFFITNSPLGFGNAGPWLKELGFDYVEGNESAYFSKYPRYTFGSPSDNTLYNRAYEVISKERGPYLLALLTVSLHPPYTLPDEKYRISDDAKLNQLNYVDHETTDFYERLKNTGFFNNGVLLLIGDHHHMAPFEPGEIRSKGIDSNGRVIAGLIGRGFNKGVINNALLNQSDISTILNLIVTGMPVAVDDLRRYNKGYLLGLNEPFTVNLISKDYIYILIRRSDKQPYLIRFKSDLDPLVFPDVIERKIAAYILMSKGWLLDRRKECGNMPGGP
jgi:hypothetical protein